MKPSGALSSISVFLSSLAGQVAVFRALLLREMQLRFGRDNIGILWLVVEPMLFASAVTTIHALAGSEHGATSRTVYPFTVMGYCLFIVFRNIFNRSEGAIQSSSPLLYHSMVTPLDIVLARAIVDATGCISALVVLLALGVGAGFADLPARPLYVFLAAFFIFWFSISLALVIASYTYEGHVLGRLVHMISYVMMPLSGAFVTMSFLPPWAQSVMKWNPMMTMFEMARYGYFQTSKDRYVYPGFAVAVCASIMLWGLLALRALRKKIHVS